VTVTIEIPDELIAALTARLARIKVASPSVSEGQMLKGRRLGRQVFATSGCCMLQVAHQREGG